MKLGDIIINDLDLEDLNDLFDYLRKNPISEEELKEYDYLDEPMETEKESEEN